jgi:hypothetical protein
MTGSPSPDDTETITCPVCQHPFAPPGAGNTGGDQCRKTASRRRHQPPPGPVTVPAAQSRREHTVYQCPACQHRLPGEQRCPDCGIFARRIGPGAPCPHCDEPVAVTDLTQEVATMPASR